MERTTSRAESIFQDFGNSRQLDIRAHQRTYDGAYTRASIAVMLFGIMVTKLFSKAFMPIAMVFTVYGSLIFLIAIHRSHQMKHYFEESSDTLYYKTSGDVVLLLSTTSIATYIAILVLLLRLE